MMTTERWVYIGRERDSKSVSYVYGQVDDDDLTECGKRFYFDKQLCRNVGRAAPGMVYDMTVNRDNGGCSVTVSGDDMPRYVGIWQDTDVLRQWQVADDAQELLKKMRGKISQDLKELSLRELLRPIADYYWRAPPSQRTAIIARVIYEVTNPTLK